VVSKKLEVNYRPSRQNKFILIDHSVYQPERNSSEAQSVREWHDLAQAMDPLDGRRRIRSLKGQISSQLKISDYIFAFKSNLISYTFINIT
jgi:hypothetical protein